MSATTRASSRQRADLADLDDQDLLAMVRSHPRGSKSREDACEQLVLRYQPMVRASALNYRESPEPTEELMQVGYVGLLKAINNFDPAVGQSLAAYAQPCISGEIKRHFRDKRWQIHVQRPLQELRLHLRNARTELSQQLARTPNDKELAEYLGVTIGDILDAQQADAAFEPWSLSAPLSKDTNAGTLEDFLGEEDPQIEAILDTEAVWAHIGELPEREQLALLMRFYGNMTQSDIGDQLGISQMHVSRLLAHALSYLRQCVFGPDQDADGVAATCLPPVPAASRSCHGYADAEDEAEQPDDQCYERDPPQRVQQESETAKY